MATGSVKRPLLIYSTVISLALAFGLVTLASAGLFRSAQFSYRQAKLELVTDLASRPTWAEVNRAVAAYAPRSEIAVITATQSAFDLQLAEARDAAAAPEAERNRNLAAASVLAPGPEAYVVERIEPTAYRRRATAEAQRLVLLSFIAALAAGFVWTMLASRLVIPPLVALHKLAADAIHDDKSEGALPSSETPNEIAEVAQSFRRSMRELHKERQRLEEKHQALEKMQQSLIRASKLASVGRLAAGIAHEIGNPLAAVVGYLSIMKSGDLAEADRNDTLERSLVQLRRIHDTIKKLLSYARQDDATPNEPIATSAILRETLILLAGHPAMRGVEVQNLVPAGDELDAIGRPGPLGQVLLNLVLNAAQAMSGQPESKIVILRTVSDDRVELSVSDNGPGVPEELREQIFDPFYTSKAPGEGTGLGLAVSRSLMEAMGGDLTIEARPPPGATFRARLMRANAAS